MMTISAFARANKTSTPIILLTAAGLSAWLLKQPQNTAGWLAAHDFKARPGSLCVMMGADGKVSQVVAGISDPVSQWDIADFSSRLPKGIYALDATLPSEALEKLAFGWALGTYRFTRYKKNESVKAQLSLPRGVDLNRMTQKVEAAFLARDLITTPAEDMGPEELANAVTRVGKKFKAKVTQIVGDDLLKKNYPAIHRVGRASYRAPRLIDLRWGSLSHPKITLIGKGVCFDTGGLDIKSSSGMYLMKKDMGGAACTLALAMMIMAADLKVRLRLLIPAVENAIGANAYRPSDVITMRNGLTVEVGNTDAEGRLILADALAEAALEKPQLLINFATLTGTARSALGLELPALFCNNDKMAEDFLSAGQLSEDPLWRLPLHQSYTKMLESSIADLNSAPASPYAGAITAALFLERFIGECQAWAHIDFMAWNMSSKPGRPEGGEAMAVRAAFELIKRQTEK